MKNLLVLPSRSLGAVHHRNRGRYLDRHRRATAITASHTTTAPNSPYAPGSMEPLRHAPFLSIDSACKLPKSILTHITVT